MKGWNKLSKSDIVFGVFIFIITFAMYYYFKG
jgi:hypothetical protein